MRPNRTRLVRGTDTPHRKMNSLPPITTLAEVREALRCVELLGLSDTDADRWRRHLLAVERMLESDDQPSD